MGDRLPVLGATGAQTGQTNHRVRKEFREQTFPGFARFDTKLSEIAKLTAGWRQVLREPGDLHADLPENQG